MALLRLSLLKLVLRPASWVILVILLGLIVFVFISLGASADLISSADEELQIELMLGFPNAYTLLVSMILSLGGLLAVIYGAAVIGADWAWGTIRSIIARGESRVRYTLITFAAIALLISVGVLATFAVGSATALLAAGMADVGSAGAADPETLAGLPDLLARTCLGVSLQGGIGFSIAMLFRSQLAGIGAGVALYFGEIFLAFVPLANEVLPYMPFNVANAVVSEAEGIGSGFETPPAIDSDLAVVLALAYLFIAIAVASLAAWRAQITQ